MRGVSLPAAAAMQSTARRPNVLLIMADTHRRDAIGVYGDPVIKTPNLDKLAAGGVRFLNCWSQHPVCMPARATIFTGRYPQSHGVRTNGVRLPLCEVTIAEAFRRAGYDTFAAGKCHFIPQLNGPLPTMETHEGPYYGFSEFHLGEDVRRGEQAVWIERNFPQWAGKPDHLIPIELHNTSWIRDHTVKFLKKAAETKKPFFAFASFVDPHQPYDPPPPYSTMYREQDMPPPLIRRGEYAARPAYLSKIVASQRPLFEHLTRHKTQSYGEVSFIDDAVGKMFATLDETGLRENTIVVYLSDHGDMLGDHYLFYKGPYHFRQCTNVPLMVSVPGAPTAGKVVEGIVQQTDLLPTLTALCEVEDPEGVQGRSQVSVLTGDSTDTGWDSALVQYGISGAHRPQAPPPDVPDLWTLRTAGWRLSYYPKLKTGELYDISEDPEEFVNQFDNAKYAAERTKLKEQLLDRMLDAKDPLPVRETPY